MKKRLLAAAVAATLTLSAGVAMAAPVALDGDVQAHYRWNNNTDNTKDEGARFTFRLNAKTALSDNVDLYARFATQGLTGDYVGADFNQDNYSDESAAAIDRFGFIVKGKDSTLNIGRQGATIGGAALLFSTEGYIGSRNGSIDGITANVKTGVTNLQIVAGTEKVTDTTSDDKNGVYALRGSYSPAKDLTVGATVAKYDVDNGDATNHWAVDAAYNYGKAGYFAEYSKSDADTDNTAFVVGTSYAFDSKNSLSVMYSKVDPNGDMGGWTDYDPDGKGMYYSYNYKIDKATTFNVFYKDMKEVSTNKSYDSFRTTVTYKF